MMTKRHKRIIFATGFTLIETLVAISILMVAIVAPMTLATQALSAAFYARDQITAFYLAQEGIEVVRSVRDHNILLATAGQSANIFDNIPLSSGVSTVDFTAAARVTDPASALVRCPLNNCPVLNTDGNLYAYSSGSAWRPSIFNRTITARENVDGQGNPDPDDILVTVTVSWQEGNYQTRTFTLTEDMYRWIAGS